MLILPSDPMLQGSTAKARNKRFRPMVKVKGTMRGSYGPGMTEMYHYASSRTRLANLRIINCKREFDHNVGEVRLIKRV